MNVGISLRGCNARRLPWAAKTSLADRSGPATRLSLATEASDTLAYGTIEPGCHPYRGHGGFGFFARTGIKSRISTSNIIECVRGSETLRERRTSRRSSRNVKHLYARPARTRLGCFRNQSRFFACRSVYRLLRLIRFSAKSAGYGRLRCSAGARKKSARESCR
jgi:hypothetical protein